MKRPKLGALPTSLAAAVLVLATVAAYKNSFRAPFLYDGVGAIVENPTIRRLWPIAPVLSPPANGETVSGRPLVNLSFAINYRLGKLDVWGYHAVNLAIHIAAGLLLLGVLRRTFLLPRLRPRFGPAATWLAAAIAAVWLLHPLQTEAVTYIVQRTESLMGLCYLLTLYCVIRGAGAGTVPFFVADDSALPATVSGEKGDCPPSPEEDAGETARSPLSLWERVKVRAWLWKPQTMSRSSATSAGGTDSSAIGVPQAQEVSRRPRAAGAAQIAELSEPPSSFLAVRPSSLAPRLWYATAVLACLAGMACKEVMVTAPIVVLLYDATFLSGAWREAIRRRKWLYVGLAATWGLLLYLTLSTGLIARQAELGAPDPWSYARTQPGVILHYLRLCFWPHPLCLDYVWPVACGFWQIALPMAAVGVLLAATVWGLWKRTTWGFLGACFFLILAPTSSILPLNGRIYEHRMYLSLAAVATFVVAAAYVLWVQCKGRMPILRRGRAVVPGWAVPLMVVLLAAVALARATADRNTRYGSAVAMYQDILDTYPENWAALSILANALQASGRIDEAIGRYREALRLKPDYAIAHNGLANAWIRKGQPEEAMPHYLDALRFDPTFAPAHYNLGLALFNAGKTDEAIARYQQALRLKPDYGDAQHSLADALLTLGRSSEAIEHYHLALRVKADDEKARNNLALALAAAGKTEEAIEQFHEALRIKPDYARAHMNLGSVLGASGRAEEALEHYAAALRLRPDYAEARENLSRLLDTMGRGDETVEAYRRFLQKTSP